MSNGALAAFFAIFAAKQRGAAEVTPDHILLGCLQAISRFGVAAIGPWNVDLEPLGIDWMRQPEGPPPKVAYSQETVELMDRAARIAKSTGEKGIGVNHLLAAFATEEDGLMGELRQAHGITSASWRTAIGRRGVSDGGGPKADRVEHEKKNEREYLTPEEAAAALGIHVQTMRAYIRSGRVPAFRLAGERSIRVLNTDLGKVLEPLAGEKREQ